MKTNRDKHQKHSDAGLQNTYHSITRFVHSKILNEENN